MSIVDGRLRGAQIGFTVGGARYTGRVGTDTMEGTVGSGGVTRNWGAVRLRAL